MWTMPSERALHSTLQLLLSPLPLVSLEMVYATQVTDNTRSTQWSSSHLLHTGMPHLASYFRSCSLHPNRYINDLSSVDHWLGTWGGHCSTIPNTLWALHHDNNMSHSFRANMMLCVELTQSAPRVLALTSTRTLYALSAVLFACDAVRRAHPTTSLCICLDINKNSVLVLLSLCLRCTDPCHTHDARERGPHPRVNTVPYRTLGLQVPSRRCVRRCWNQRNVRYPGRVKGPRDWVLGQRRVHGGVLARSDGGISARSLEAQSDIL
jgi:hypothetical protein